MSVKLITWEQLSPDDLGMFGQLSGWPGKRLVENAGKGILELLRKIREQLNPNTAAPSKRSKKAQSASSGATETDEPSTPKTSKADQKALIADAIVEQDHYALLGLQDIRWAASADQIRKAYRKMALIYHPDKQAGDPEEDSSNDAAFKAIHKAFEVLSDPKKKREYDSSEYFDDSVPNMKESENFYEVYGPVFFRNSKWSSEKPVPLLGDDSTPIKQVEDFYEFWNNFKSWRDFAGEDEHDLDQASCREERRWMEKENERDKVKKRKDENVRLRRLIDLAYKYDPRIARKKQAEIDAKERKKQEKLEAKRLEEEEKLRKEEEERKKIEDEERQKVEEAAALKRQKEKEKKNLKKERSNLKSIVKAVVESIPDLKPGEVDELNNAAEHIASVTGIDDLRELSQDMGLLSLNPNQFIGKLRQVYEEKKSIPKTTTPSPSPLPSPAVPKAVVVSPKVEPKKNTEWTRVEISLLAQGIAKYPGGASNRWQQIADLIGTRTPEEVIEKTKSMKKGEVVKPIAESLPGEKKAAIQAEPTARETLVEAETKTESPAVAKAAQQAASPKVSSPETAAKEVPKKAEAPTSAPAATSVWSAEQQKALETGLKTHSAQLTDRWDRIAEMVPGKTKKECIVRFKELREKLKASQGS